MRAEMLIYGQENLILRLRELEGRDSRIRKILESGCKTIFGREELEKAEEPQTGLLVPDMSDVDVLRLLYRKGWKKLYFPVCGTILSVSDPAADQVLAEKLLHCTNWRWHKEANRFRMLRSYFLRRAVTDSLPSHIQLEHTSYCNARCIMCGHAIYGNRGAQHISEELVERMKSLLPTCEVMVLHGYGEPLMTKNLASLLELYRKYEIDVTMNTNLSVLPPEVLEVLPSVTQHLRISCDGVTKEVYEGIRPGLQFSQFLENLRRLRQYAPQMELMMETVIMRQNVEQIPQMVRFASEYGFSQISLNRLGSHPVLNNERDCLTHYPNLTSRCLKEGLELGEKLGVRMYYPVEWLLSGEDQRKLEEERRAAAALPFRIPPLECREEQKVMTHSAVWIGAEDPLLLPGTYACCGMCDSLLGRTNLDLCGNVYACCMNTLQKTGNLFEMEDGEFYNAPALVKMREQFYRGEIPRYCDECSYVMNHTLVFADVEKRDT